MKKAFFAVLIVMAVGILVGCQPTPELEFVTNKGEGLLEQKIKESNNRAQTNTTAPDYEQGDAAPTPTPFVYEHPKTWQDTIEMKNFLVHIDATIKVLPGNYPIVRVVPSSFADRSNDVFSLKELLIGEITEKRDGIFTYEDYAKEISLYSLGRFDSDLYAYVPWTKDEMDEVNCEVNAQMERMQKAPMEEDFYPSNSFSAELNSELAYRNAKGEVWYVTLSDGSLTISLYKGRVYPESYFINEKPISPDEPMPTPYPNIRISEEQAREEAEAFLRKFGEGSFAVASIARAGMLKPVYNVLEEEHTEAEGYLVTCMRTCGDTILYADISFGTGRLHFTDDSYSAPLATESFSLFITETGVCSLTWENPLFPKETLADSVELLPFTQIQQIYVQMMKNGLSWSDTRYSDGTPINSTRIGYVDRAILSYTIVSERNNYGSYLMVPTWLFFYETGVERALKEDGYSFSPTNIAINAVDGTRIEFGNGVNP